MQLYELAIIGDELDPRIPVIHGEVERMLRPFHLNLGTQVGWAVGPNPPALAGDIPAAILFLGNTPISALEVQCLLEWKVPILPVVSRLDHVSSQIPPELGHLNAMACDPSDSDSATRVASAFLECIGLLPRQRRVFVSYRRTEATEVAHQLFAELSARQFDVFLDTHKITPGVEFQDHLWHRLCESDVLIMLDTMNYFASRWTAQEFGAAEAKGFAILRVGWPGVTPSNQVATTYPVKLETRDIDPGTKQLAPDALKRVCLELEFARSKSIAVRTRNLIGHVERELSAVHGEVIHVGPHHALHLKFGNGNEAIAYLAIGVPTSTTLHEAANRGFAKKATRVAVVYDRASILPKWIEHLDWLGTHVKTVRWIKAHDFESSTRDWRV